MLGYDLLQCLSDARSRSDVDRVSEVDWTHSGQYINMPADVPSQPHQLANFDGLSQLRWHYSQTIFVRC